MGKYVQDNRLSWALCNLRDIKDIRDSAKKAAEFFDDRIDVLINNGGISSPFWKDGKSMGDFDTAVEWQAYLETNLSAPFLLSQAVLPYMKTSNNRETRKQMREGASPCILHISSFRMLQSDPNQEGYASSKSGMIGLTHSMAVSLSEFGIRVNLIAPGRIRVAHESKKGDEEGLQWKIEGDDAEKFAANRGGMPEDIAECAEWLIGAGFVTGQSITVSCPGPGESISGFQTCLLFYESARRRTTLNDPPATSEVHSLAVSLRLAQLSPAMCSADNYYTDFRSLGRWRRNNAEEMMRRILDAQR